jgi:hypothetical protein
VITAESVDGTPSPQDDTKAADGNGNDNGMEGDKDGEEGDGEGEGGDEQQQKLVFIGSDVNRTWTQHFDVVEVAAEILANMACLVRNTVLSAGAAGDEEYEDWSDDEESELKMEQIAAANASPSVGNGNSVTSSGSSAVNDVSPPLSPLLCCHYPLLPLSPD